jgi:deazaflavin-dependent oxidoreductase (nitroreductase family)
MREKTSSRQPRGRHYRRNSLRAVKESGDGRITRRTLPLVDNGRSNHRGAAMSNYVPSPVQWVREQVELYESSGGTKGTTLRDTGLPVIIVTNTGNKTGSIRKTPLMRARDGNNYILVGSQGGAPKNPVWVYNLRANPRVEIRDETRVQSMKVREITDAAERSRLWKLAAQAFPPYDEYQRKTSRQIPVFLAEPV